MPTPRVLTNSGVDLCLWCIEDEREEAVLFVHGATYPGRAVFAPAPEYSWLSATAAAGRDAYALDVRGYGDSDAPEAMDAAPGEADPPVRTDVAATDVRAALDFLPHDRIHLVGYSWGTMIAGRLLAGDDAPAVASYAAFAPVFEPPPERAAEFDPGDPPHPARIVTESEARDRWESQFPEGSDPGDWRDRDAFEAFWDAVYESGQGVPGLEDPAIRAPNGTIVDLQRAADGEAPYDPGEVRAPTLVVRGSNDPTATREDALSLYDALADARRYVELARGTHFMPLERRRAALYDTLNAFHDRLE